MFTQHTRRDLLRSSGSNSCTLRRAAILDRKLDLISRTANTVLDLLKERRSSRVEWYIVILIILEIALSVYGLLSAR